MTTRPECGLCDEATGERRIPWVEPPRCYPFPESADRFVYAWVHASCAQELRGQAEG